MDVETISPARARARFGPNGSLLSTLADRWSSPRDGKVPISTHKAIRLSTAASEELQNWIGLFECWELEAADPAETELRAPGDLPSLGHLLSGATGPSTLADLFSLLTASTVIAQRDELAYLASLAGTREGVSKVYSFHPEDWGIHLSDASISLYLHRVNEGEKRTPRPFSQSQVYVDHPGDRELANVYNKLVKSMRLPGLLDPIRLASRCDWIVRAWMGLPISPASLKKSHLKNFEIEKPELATYPHLGLYWLFAHAFLNHSKRLEETLMATRNCTDPWVQEAQQVIRTWSLGHECRLGPLKLADFESVRDEILSAAPATIKEGSQLTTATVPFSISVDDIPVESPTDIQFLDLFEKLANARPLQKELSADALIELEQELASKAHPKYIPLLDSALEGASRVPDHHPRAGCGRILARATISSGIKDFENALQRAGGTKNFGPRRRDEWWRAIALFFDESSNKQLFKGASDYTREASEWIRTAPKTPWTLLLKRDTLQTHDLVSQFLQTAPLNVAAVPLILEAAHAAQTHHISRAIPGLRRAIAYSVVPLEANGRKNILWTLAELDPQASRFLAKLMSSVRSDWETAKDEDKARARALDLSVIVGALLVVDSEHKEAQAIAASLIARFAVELSPKRRPTHDVLYALLALSAGIQEGEAYSLVEPLRTLLELRPKKPRARASKTTLAHKFWEQLEDIVSSFFLSSS